MNSASFYILILVMEFKVKLFVVMRNRADFRLDFWIWFRSYCQGQKILSVTLNDLGFISISNSVDFSIVGRNAEFWKCFLFRGVLIFTSLMFGKL